MHDKKELFETIYEKTKESTFRFIAARCYDLNDIDDIFQNVYLSVYDALQKRDKDIPNIEAFVILIAKRELFKYYGLIKRIKALARQDGYFENTDPPDPDTLNIEDTIIDRELLDNIAALISKKSLATQKIFLLYYREGMTLQEISKLLGMNESVVKKKLYGTLSQLRRLYGKES